jgi:hypothetical protein
MPWAPPQAPVSSNVCLVILAYKQAVFSLLKLNSEIKFGRHQLASSPDPFWNIVYIAL